MKKDSHNFYCGGVQHWHEDVVLKNQQRWTDGCWWLVAAWCKSDLCFSPNLTMTSLMTGALAKCGFEEEKSFSWDCQSHIPTHFFFYGTIFSIHCSGLHYNFWRTLVVWPAVQDVPVGILMELDANAGNQTLKPSVSSEHKYRSEISFKKNEKDFCKKIQMVVKYHKMPAHWGVFGQ